MLVLLVVALLSVRVVVISVSRVGLSFSSENQIDYIFLANEENELEGHLNLHSPLWNI